MGYGDPYAGGPPVAHDPYAMPQHPSAAVPHPYSAAYGAYTAGGPPPAVVEEVRTIFITGFPPDVKERELNNLLRYMPGYEVRAAAHFR